MSCHLCGRVVGVKKTLGVGWALRGRCGRSEVLVVNLLEVGVRDVIEVKVACPTSINTRGKQDFKIHTAHYSRRMAHDSPDAYAGIQNVLLTCFHLSALKGIRVLPAWNFQVQISTAHSGQRRIELMVVERVRVACFIVDNVGACL